MNEILILLLSANVFAVASPIAAPQHWDPDQAVVERVDAEVAKLPNFTGFNCQSRNITEFARHYGGFTDERGRRMIVGQLLLLSRYPNEHPGIHIDRRPKVSDGGCNVANVWFDADTLELIQASWGGR
jgi:hypothetical protein